MGSLSITYLKISELKSYARNARKPARRFIGLHGIGAVAIKALERAQSLTAGR